MTVSPRHIKHRKLHRLRQSSPSPCCSLFVFHYNLIIQRDSNSSCLKPYKAQAKVLKQGPRDIYNFSWWRCALLLAFSQASPSSVFLSTSPSGPNALSQHEVPDNFDEEVFIFRLNASLAMYQTFTSFDSACSPAPIETTIFARARLDAWNAFVRELLRDGNVSKAGARRTNQKISGTSFAQASSSS